MKFYRCAHCGNIVAMIKDSGVVPFCCGEVMKEINANTVDASQEKHLPIFKEESNIVHVQVGSVEHPMSEEHYIEWIMIVTDQGRQRKKLKPNDKPQASFAILENEILLEVYAYCNLHGLWKSKA